MPTGRFLSRKEILFDLEIVTWPPMGTARRFLRMSWPKLDTVKIGSGRPRRRRSLMTSARQERMNRPASLRGFFEEGFLPGGLDSPAVRALEEKGVSIRRDGKIKEIRGDERVEAVLVEGASGAETIPVSAVFLFREIPAGPLFERAGLVLDHKQCVAVDRFQRTNIPGVFAAGDITCGGLQVVAAAGEGCVAAMQALIHLRS